MKSLIAEKFDKRARALEKKGLEIEVIGRKPLPLKVQKKRAFQRIAHHLVFGDSGRDTRITVSGAPQIKGSRISVGLSLDIPIGKPKLRLSREDKKLFEAILLKAILERVRLQRSESISRTSPHRSSHRRGSTGP